MYETAQVNWGDGTVVKIIIFANYAPEVDKVSTDRLQVYKINRGTLDWRKDLDFDAKLAVQDAEFVWLDQEIEDAITNGPQIVPSDAEAVFALCYNLRVDKPAILSDKMHFVLERAGYNQSKKAMNKWIREHFRNELGSGVVREINQSHRVAWKGFKPKPTSDA
jgi:hypothetical protein